MPAKEMKRRARCAAKTVDGLIRISDRKDISVVPLGQSRQNLDLREVGVLKFINQNEAGTAPLLFQYFFISRSAIRGPA